VLIRLCDTAESHSSPAQGAHLKDQGSCQQENRFRQRDRQGGRWVCYILFSFVSAPSLGSSETLFICCCSGSSNILHGQHFNNSQRRCATFNATTMTYVSINTTSSSNNRAPVHPHPRILNTHTSLTNTSSLQSRTIRAPRHRTPPQQQGQART